MRPFSRPDGVGRARPRSQPFSGGGRPDFARMRLVFFSFQPPAGGLDYRRVSSANAWRIVGLCFKKGEAEGETSMTPDLQREVESFASTILRRYFCDSDVEFLISTFESDIVWLGGGEAMQAEGAEEVARFFRVGAENMLTCRMWDERYVTRELAPGVYLCEGTSRLESVAPGTALTMLQRITFVFRRDKHGALKIVHIHNSMPFDALKSDELFPMTTAKEAFRRLQEQLSRQNRQIELMLSQLPGGLMICLSDEHFTTKWLSPGLYRLLGYKSPEEYGEACSGCCRGFILPEDYDLMWNQVTQALAHGDSYSVEYRVRRKDGSVLWVMDIGQYFVDEDGEGAVTCLITDITKRMEREQTIRIAHEEIARQAAFLSQLYNTVPCGIVQFVLDPEPRIVSINPQALKIYDYSPEEAETGPGDPFFRVMEADMAWVRGLTDRLVREGGRVVYERRFRLEDGSSRWLNVIMEHLVNADGIQVVQALFTDITEKKKSQLEHEREQLRKQRSLQAAVCSAYPLIIHFNLTRNSYESFSARGYVAELLPQGNYAELMKRSAQYVDPAYQEDFLRSFAPEEMERRFAAGEQEIYQEYRRLGDDGAWHWVAAQCIRVDNPDGADILGIMMLKVLDEQQAEKKRQEQLMRDALAAAQAANRAKSDFLSRMSHDIRTPMNAIIGMSAIGQLKLDERDAVRNCFTKIDASCRYLLSLINDIHDMSRIESGKIALTNARFDLADLVNQVDAIIVPQAEAAGIDYEVYHSTPLEAAYIGDALRLNQILMNLLANALKFTPAGGNISVHIRELRRTNGFAHMEFTIRDSGIGMSSEFMRRIFQPFEQENADMARNKAGSGLGLSIVYNLVHIMGGSIQVHSKQGQGSEFIVTVPLGLAEDDEERENLRKSQNLLTGLKVLVVDDDALVGEQASVIMRGIGAECRWVESGFMAVEAVREALKQRFHYDVALIDWKMPDMDGVETTRRLRKLVGPETTIIIITAYDWSAIEAEAREAGADAFIAKPLFPSTLCKTFASLYADRRQAVSDDQVALPAGSRLLLVEDNALNLEIAKSLLEMHGLTVDTAENGLEAVRTFEKAEEGRYQAILMDIRMPIMDGLDATRAIRALTRPDAVSVPIIAMTANAFDEDKPLAEAAGMNAYLVKPLDMDVMFATLREWL